MKKSRKRPLKILIPNATSPKNPGDQAMLQVLIGMVRNLYPNASITVHSIDPHLYKSVDFQTKHTLYSWSVFSDRKTIARAFRVSLVVMQYALLRMGIKNVSLSRSLSHLIDDYKDADLIFFVGGGYLHAKKGITQTLNLSMYLFLFKYAALFTGRKIVGPISVGPFGYAFQERATIRELRKMDKVAVREDISHAIVNRYSLKNVVRASDHALMIERKNNARRSPKKITLGFTVRKWLMREKQEHFEKSILWAIGNFVLATGARVQPIVQVDASEYGEDDVAITKALTKKLTSLGIDVLPIKTIHSMGDAMRIYSNLDLLLGMRMHSNIFAASQGVPFVAISYEHKTEGIARELSMEAYCISCEKIDGKSLSNLLIKAFRNRKNLSKQLLGILEKTQKTGEAQWNKYLAM